MKKLKKLLIKLNKGCIILLLIPAFIWASVSLSIFCRKDIGSLAMRFDMLMDHLELAIKNWKREIITKKEI